MWKSVLVDAALKTDLIRPVRRLSALAAVILLLVSACAPAAEPTALPTQTLVVPTATWTPLPVTATPSPTPLLRPVDLETPTPDDAAPPTLSDPVAAELVALAQRRMAQDLGLPVQRIHLVEVTAVTWPDTSLGCPQTDEIYAQGTFDGYRIVLSASGQEYIFHTDFDRAIPCAAEDERLPESSG
jgi:hypothetical protein